MAENNVTPIRPKPERPKRQKGSDITKATDEQQDRVWRLRALIQCVREADWELVDDSEAALDGLADYASSIHLALDAGALKERAKQLEEDSHD